MTDLDFVLPVTDYNILTSSVLIGHFSILCIKFNHFTVRSLLPSMQVEAVMNGKGLPRPGSG